MIIITPQAPEFEDNETQWDDQAQEFISPTAPQFDDEDEDVSQTPWVLLTLIDPPPYLANQAPAAGEIGVASITNVLLDVLDAGAGVNLSTVQIWIDGVLAVDAGVGQAGWPTIVTAQPRGWRFNINPVLEFTPGSTIPVRVRAVDTSAWLSVLDTVYQFEIGLNTPPVVDEQSPTPGSTNVDKDEPISFRVVDLETDVLLSSTRVWVRGSLAWDGTEATEGWTVLVSRVGSIGYAFELIPDRSQYHRANEQSSVRVVATDLTSLSVDTSWVFTGETGFPLKIYRFLIGSVRDKDEDGDPPEGLG